MKTITTQVRNRTDAIIRTDLNIVLICLLNPIKNPVPVNEIKIPKVYRSAKLTTLPNTNKIDPIIEITNPPTRQPKKPYNLCFLDNPKNSNAEGWVTSSNSLLVTFPVSMFANILGTDMVDGWV